MVLKLFSVFDRKAAAYWQPFCAATPGMAERFIMDQLSEPKSPMAKYPEDFSLVHVGDWDDSAGKCVGFQEPKVVCQVAALVRPSGNG